jgi:hypothetical protein
MGKASGAGIGSINKRSINRARPKVCKCSQPIDEQRLSLGYLTCLICGAKEASKRKFTVVPMPKSNYILVTDLSLLKGLNSSHKGGLA